MLPSVAEKTACFLIEVVVLGNILHGIWAHGQEAEAEQPRQDAGQDSPSLGPGGAACGSKGSVRSSVALWGRLC